MKSHFSLVSTLALAVCLIAHARDADSAEINCTALTPGPISEVINPNTKASMLISSPSQAASGFTQNQGTLFFASPAGATGLVGAHQMYNPSTNDYFWTISSNEVTSAVNNYGYVDRGIGFYVSSAAASCTQPVYRFQSGSMHRFAVNDADRNDLTASGWKFEGIMFYGVLPPKPTSDLPAWTRVYSNGFDTALGSEWASL